MIKIKVKNGKREYPIIMTKVSPTQEFLINYIFKNEMYSLNNFYETKKTRNGEIFYVDNFKEFIFSSEKNTFKDPFKIYPTEDLISEYPESFGKHGQNTHLYIDTETKNILHVYYPNIEYVRKFRKNYLKELYVIKIKDNKIIHSENIDEKYLQYIENMLTTEKMDYKYFNFAFLYDGIYTFYNLDMKHILLDIAACLDKVHSHYKKAPWTNFSSGSTEKYFPDLFDKINGLKTKSEIIQDKEEFISLGYYIVDSISKNNFNPNTFDNYIKRGLNNTDSCFYLF